MQIKRLYRNYLDLVHYFTAWLVGRCHPALYFRKTTNKIQVIPVESIKTYCLQGIDRFGNPQAGICKATSITECKQKLNSIDVIITKYIKSQVHKLKRSSIGPMLNQLATLLQANIPILTALDLMLQYPGSVALQHLILTIKHDLTHGHSLAQALQQHHYCIDAFNVQLIMLGENSGTLIITLQNIAAQQQLRQHYIQTCTKKLTYPLLVLSLGSIITIGLLIIVVPQFANLFQQFNVPLPYVTKILISSANFIKRYGIISLSICSILGYLIYKICRKSTKCKQYIIDSLIYVPIIGKNLLLLATARFANALSLGYTAGLPLLTTLQLIEPITGFPKMARAINHMHFAIMHGQRLHEVMQATGLFTTQMLQLIKLGETSGQLTTLLNTIAQQTMSQIEQRLNIIIQCIEPCLMTLLGICIGGLLIALYLPLFEFGSIIT